MGRISVTISYSFRCLTTETVKYTNENSFIAFAFMHLADAFIQSYAFRLCIFYQYVYFIDNLASSKYSMWAQKGKQM